MPEFDALACSEVVFRAALFKKWIRGDGKIQWQAFKRKLKDIDGVSVSLIPEFEGLNNPIEGIISVKVGRVRDASTEEYKIDIQQDTEKHANITGLLCPDNFEGAERQRIDDAMTAICIKIAERAARAYT